MPTVIGRLRRTFPSARRLFARACAAALAACVRVGADRHVGDVGPVRELDLHYRPCSHGGAVGFHDGEIASQRRLHFCQACPRKLRDGVLRGIFTVYRLLLVEGAVVVRLSGGGEVYPLAAVKGKSNITIKINSCGGDLYTGIAIHNAIKGLTGHKVVVVEGIAASAASVIACAGDEVQVYPGSMVMIHGVAGLLYDYYTLADLKKLQKDFDASERAIAEIYHAKTGIEVDQLRSMMTRETWMVGQEAIDNGFADTLLTDEGPDVTLSADKKVLLVAGIRHDVKGFRHIPGTIPIDNSIHAAPAAGNKHAAAKNDGPKKEDNKTMTLEEMRAQHPDVVAQIEQQAAETARTQERARIEAIDSIAASVGDAQLVRDAKYGETPCTAEQLALKAMQKQAALGAKHLKDAKADNDESGAAGVGAAPNGGEEGSENDDKAKVDAIVGLYNSTKSQNGGKK